MNIFKPKQIQTTLPFKDCNLCNQNKIFKIDERNTKIARKNGQEYWLWNTSELQSLIIAAQNHDGVTRHSETARILGVLFKFTDDEVKSVIYDALNGKYNYHYVYSKYKEYNGMYEDICDCMQMNDYCYFDALFDMCDYYNNLELLPFSSHHIGIGTPRPNYCSKLNDDNSIIKNYYTVEEVKKKRGVVTINVKDLPPEDEIIKMAQRELDRIEKERNEKQNNKK